MELLNSALQPGTGHDDGALSQERTTICGPNYYNNTLYVLALLRVHCTHKRKISFGLCDDRCISFENCARAQSVGTRWHKRTRLFSHTVYGSTPECPVFFHSCRRSLKYSASTQSTTVILAAISFVLDFRAACIMSFSMFVISGTKAVSNVGPNRAQCEQFLRTRALCIYVRCVRFHYLFFISSLTILSAYFLCHLIHKTLLFCTSGINNSVLTFKLKLFFKSCILI